MKVSTKAPVSFLAGKEKEEQIRRGNLFFLKAMPVGDVGLSLQTRIKEGMRTSVTVL